MVKTVTKTDSSITDTPRKPKGNKTFEVDDYNQSHDKQTQTDNPLQAILKQGATQLLQQAIETELNELL